MLSLQGLTELINDKARKEPANLQRWKDVYYGMSLHIDGACPKYQYLREVGGYAWVQPKNYFGEEYQRIFDTSLFSRHPREAEVTRQWRLSQYKPFTQAPFLQVIQVITGAIFQDSGYSIVIDNKDDNDYIWGNNFNGKDLPGYISSKFQMIAADPNGMFVVIPEAPYYDTRTPRVQPQVWFVLSKDIIWTTPDEVIFCKGDLIWVVNKLGYFRFQKVEEKWVNIDGAAGGYYAHMLQRLPVHTAGGQWNNQGFYESHLNAAKAVADDFVSGKSAEQLVNKEASHPFIIEASEDCPECNHTGTIQRPCDTCPGDFELIQCARCGGTGEISHNPGDRLIAPREDMANALIQIVNPDINVNKFHAENNREIYNGMLRALHLNYIEEAQSGTAKDKDMETRYQFIVGISNDLFDRLIPGLVTDISAIRNVAVSQGRTTPAPGTFTIVKPTQFQIKTAADLLAEYDAATKAMVPTFVKARQIEDYVDKQFGGDDLLKRKTWLINQMDIFSVSTMSEISTALLNGVDGWLFQLHIHLPGILDQLVRTRTKEWLLTSPFDTIKAEVDTIFDQLAPPVPKLNERSAA